MAYNYAYGQGYPGQGYHAHGAPGTYGNGYPGNNAQGMNGHYGLAPGNYPPGMAPPGVDQPQHAAMGPPGMPNGFPPGFQPPANMANIDFTAPVIRLGTTGGRSGPPAAQEAARGSSNRPGLGMERGERNQPKEITQVLVPPTSEEKVRTMFVSNIPESLTGGGIEQLLGVCGKLRRFDHVTGVYEDLKGVQFGLAHFEKPESLSIAIKLFHDASVEVPTTRQTAKADQPDDDEFEGIEKTHLVVTVDDSAVQYLELYEEEKGDVEGAEHNLAQAKEALKTVIRGLFYPVPGSNAGNNATMNVQGGNVEVVNITIAQDDELSGMDIPAEMREIVAGEISAFRERSTQRDLDRLKKEEQFERTERRKNDGRSSRLDSPPGGGGINAIPLGPRGMTNAPTGPKGHLGPNRTQAFVSAGMSNTDYSINRADEDSDADDEELYKRHTDKKKAEQDQMYAEAERKWASRERARQGALDREKAREQQEEESFEKRKQAQLDKEKTWSDEREAGRRAHLFHRDRSAWAQKRDFDRVQEEQADAADRRAEQDEQRAANTNQGHARDTADSFLSRQAKEMETPQPAVAAPAQPFKLSLGAAAQKAQASKAGPKRRTIAEIEGLLDNEDDDAGPRRQLVPIVYEKSTAMDRMTDAEVSQAVKALAAEIPSDQDGLWKWDVQWDHLDQSIVRDKLRPFLEKKVIEFLGVQEDMIVTVVEDHLKNRSSAAVLTEDLQGALGDVADDLVKKLWRMLIFYTECEKRGLPA